MIPVPNQNENQNLQTLSKFSYLAIVPRGLQSEISSSLQEQAKTVVALDDEDNDDDGDDANCSNEKSSSSSSGQESDKDENDTEPLAPVPPLKVTTWNEKEDNETMREALRDFSLQKEEKQKRRGNKKNTVDHQPTKIQLEENISSAWFPPRCSVGSVKLSSSGQHVSIGYYSPSVNVATTDATTDTVNTATATTTATTTTTTTTNQQGVPSSPPCALSWTCTGQMAGSVWMQLETDQKRISQKVIAPSRSMGPLLALASVQTDNRCLETRAPSPTTTTTTNEKTQNGHQQKQAQSQAQAQEHNHYQRYHQHSLQEMTAEVVRHLGSNPALFSERLDRAFRVWKDCVQCTWKNRLSSSDYEGLQNRIRENRLRFRLSCVRVEPIVVPSSFSRKKKKKFNAMPELFSYSRKDLCRAIMEACGPELVPNFFNQYTNRIRHSKEISSNNNISSSSSNNDEEKETSVSTDSKSEEGSGRWTVDLDKFDIELVVFIVPPDPRSKNGKLAFGISLRPHSFLQSRSFETGQIPRDVTAPYLGGEILSQGIVRLRPTTAHLLLQIANLQPYDVVLDPCAGIGTIPVEAEQYQACFETSTAGRIGPSEKKKQYLAIGGDLVLNNPKYTRIAGIMEHANGYTVGSGNSNRSSSLLVAWDAAQLPMRTSCVDVAVSDLPFGQQCLSVNALNQLLPLIFLECARVLRPNTGRMIMLAGGSPIAVVANMEKLSGKYWKKPIPRVSPVSIGGILAWIIVGIRNETPFDRNIVPKQLTLVRKIAEKRDRINRQRNSESGEQQRDKRRRKTND